MPSAPEQAGLLPPVLGLGPGSGTCLRLEPGWSQRLEHGEYGLASRQDSQPPVPEASVLLGSPGSRPGRRCVQACVASWAPVATHVPRHGNAAVLVGAPSWPTRCFSPPWLSGASSRTDVQGQRGPRKGTSC